MFLATWSDGANIFFTLLAVAGFAALTVFLYFRFQKERKNIKEEKLNFIEGTLSKSEINSLINAYVNRVTKDTLFSLIFFDVDQFKNIVNAFGEAESKRTIEILIREIKSVLPNKMPIGRYGKDRFLIFVKDELDRSQCLQLAEQIREKAKQTIKLYNDTSLNLTISVALSFFPMHGETLKKLMNSLEIAMYTAKRDGGDKVALYSDEMDQTESENLQYYTQVKSAIANKEFQLYYQPIVDIEKREVFGAEALLRWNHPEFGVLSPFKFINILEQSGDINWIGVWGIETIVQEYFNLKKEFTFKDFQISFNLSPKQLIKENLAIDFQKILKKYKMNAKNIIIEVEEFIIFEQHKVIRDNILKLKEIGFRIAVDGFALDNSTLQKINNMPIDIIKLDRSFLEDEGQTYIKEKFTELLIDFAKKNNILIIAEGLENYDKIEYIRSHEISYVQGYHFSKPVSSIELTAYIRNEKLLDKQLTPPTNSEEQEADDLIEIVSEELKSNLTDVKSQIEVKAAPLSDTKIGKKSKSKNKDKNESLVEKSVQLNNEETNTVQNDAKQELENPIISNNESTINDEANNVVAETTNSNDDKTTDNDKNEPVSTSEEANYDQNKSE